jgi:DNA-binding Xre family transcriptional regulator
MGLTDDKKFLKAIGQRVNKIRKEKKMSFQELSFRTDIEKSNLVKLTTQGSNITVSTLNKIAQGLEVSAKELLP